MQAIKKPRLWITALILILIGCILFILLGGRKAETDKVCIMQDGKCLYEIDLSAVDEPYRIELHGDTGGFNLVCVEKNRICISQADCPDRICVNQGWLEGELTPIVCLPNQVVIMYVDE